MNMFKKNGGFTLVELIVVIAILAILAGVALPMYSGYITKAQDAAAITELDALSTSAQAANATAGEVTKLELNAAGTEVTVTASAFSSTYEADFQLFSGDEDAAFANGKITLGDAIDLANTSYKNGATWTNADGWKAN